MYKDTTLNSYTTIRATIITLAVTYFVQSLKCVFLPYDQCCVFVTQ